MTILNRFYASSGAELMIDTLEVNLGARRFFLAQGFQDVSATLETGETVVFQQCVMDLALPARNADGTQDLRMAISNIDGQASTEIRLALKNKQKITLVYRCYFDADRAAPAKPPIRMQVKSGTWDNTVANLTASFRNILDLAFLRRRYTTSFAPGLRYT